MHDCGQPLIFMMNDAFSKSRETGQKTSMFYIPNIYSMLCMYKGACPLGLFLMLYTIPP